MSKLEKYLGQTVQVAYGERFDKGYIMEHDGGYWLVGDEGMMTRYHDEENLEVIADDSFRVCNHCSCIMTEGYVIENGEAYYCGDNCMEADGMTKEQYEELHEDGEGDSYWTQWGDNDPLFYTSRMGRKIEFGMLVGVHWNSHKNVYSVVSMKSRNTIDKVLGYVHHITLIDCTTKVDKAKQKKVRESGVKDRHAFVVGYVANTEVEHLERSVYYKPACLDSFVDAQMYFEEGREVYLEKVKRVNLDYNHDEKRPVVTYNL